MTGYPQTSKLKAIRFRKQGMSYNEIRKHIHASKSTLSIWLKSIPLKPEHKLRLYTKRIQILARGPQSQRERRLREISKIVADAKDQIQHPISTETYRLIGACLYWAEGRKGNRMEVTNSDPALILFMVQWFHTMFGVPINELHARLNIYSQQNDDSLKRFWSDLTGIPTGNFGKSYVKPANKGYKKNTLYFGTVRIEVPKSADNNQRIFAWIKGMLSDVEPKAIRVQKKWSSLTKIQRPVNLESE